MRASTGRQPERVISSCENAVVRRALEPKCLADLAEAWAPCTQKKCTTTTSGRGHWSRVLGNDTPSEWGKPAPASSKPSRLWESVAAKRMATTMPRAPFMRPSGTASVEHKRFVVKITLAPTLRCVTARKFRDCWRPGGELCLDCVGHNTAPRSVQHSHHRSPVPSTCFGSQTAAAPQWSIVGR